MNTRKLIFVCIFAVVSMHGIYSQDFEVLMEFPVGKGDGEFWVAPANPYEPTVPKGLAVVGDNVYVAEFSTGRIIHISPDGKWEDIDSTANLYISLKASDKYLLATTPGYLAIFSLPNHELLIEGRTETFARNSSNTNNYTFANTIIDDYIIFLDGYSGKFHEYVIFEVTEEKKIIVHNPEDTLELINNSDEGFSLIDFNIIKYKDVYLALNTESFKFLINSVWGMGKNYNLGWTKPMGWDKYDNYYFGDPHGYNLIVIDKFFDVIASIENEHGKHTQFAMNEDGTIYYMRYNEDEHIFQLMKLDPYWNEQRLESEP